MEELTLEERKAQEKERYEEEQRKKKEEQEKLLALVELCASLPISSQADMKMMFTGVTSLTSNPDKMNENSTVSRVQILLIRPCATHS